MQIKNSIYPNHVVLGVLADVEMCRSWHLIMKCNIVKNTCLQTSLHCFVFSHLPSIVFSHIPSIEMISNNVGLLFLHKYEDEKYVYVYDWMSFEFEQRFLCHGHYVHGHPALLTPI